MVKLIIDIKRTHRKREPINIEIVKVGNDFKIDEALLYALQAVIDIENERKELKMTKEELIKSFERNNWELHEIYKAKLLALNYGELVDKLIHLKSQTAIVNFGG